MKFCKTCQNMLYLSVDSNDSNTLSLYCRFCGHRENMESNLCVINTRQSNCVLKNNVINKYTKLDPTLPRIYTLPCPNMNCQTHATENATPRDVLYIRYDDDKLKYLYLCCNCDTIWE